MSVTRTSKAQVGTSRLRGAKVVESNTHHVEQCSRVLTSSVGNCVQAEQRPGLL